MKSTHVNTKVSLDTRRTAVPKGDSVKSYVVKYGDGSRTASGKGLPHNLSHRYAKAGTYTITLTITDVRHRSSSAKAKVVVTKVVTKATTPATTAPVTTAPVTTAPVTVVPTTAAPTAAPTTAAPTADHPAIQLAGGADFVCALVSGGTVDCWGENSAGELGIGTTSDYVAVPTKVTGLSGVTAITAGASHACALLKAGTVDCWGYNQDGQLGLGDQTLRSAPTAVPGLSGVVAISAYRELTCAVLGTGTAECWGLDDKGQVGNGFDNSEADAPSTLTPQAVSGITTAVSVTGAGQHTCALISGGTEKCWGSNYQGQLGLGTSPTGESSPTAVTALTGITSISAGGSNSCAIYGAGSLDCWGLNSYGQVGDGATDGATVYTPTSTGLAGAIAVANTEANATCAILGDGSVDCWGYDGQGEIGTGTPLFSPATPTPTQPLP